MKSGGWTFMYTEKVYQAHDSGVHVGLLISFVDLRSTLYFRLSPYCKDQLWKIGMSVVAGAHLMIFLGRPIDRSKLSYKSSFHDLQLVVGP